jgi:hypothetical protein
MLYRILTENVNKEQIVKIVSLHFDGFTIYEAEGYWKGKPEKALVIEIDSGNDLWLIMKIAKEIKAFNCQESVMVQGITTLTEFV